MSRHNANVLTFPVNVPQVEKTFHASASHPVPARMEFSSVYLTLVPSTKDILVFTKIENLVFTKIENLVFTKIENLVFYKD